MPSVRNFSIPTNNQGINLLHNPLVPALEEPTTKPVLKKPKVFILRKATFKNSINKSPEQAETTKEQTVVTHD
jgi:hypothetical protein